MTNERRKISPLALIFLLSGTLFVLFVGASALFFFKSPGSAPRPVRSALLKGGAVGLLEVNGVIMDSKRALKDVERLEEDEAVKAIVVRINSPGGAVAPSQEIYEALKRLKKPVVASMGSVAASGGYYIAVAAQKIYANAGTITGSIGVIMEFANLEKLYEWAKVKRYSLKTGKYKDAGADYREMTVEDRALLQGMIDDVLIQFKTAVASSRKMQMSDLDGLADGRIFSGAQAKAVKLVDEIGTLDEAIEAAAKLGGVPSKDGKKPHVILPDRPRKTPRIFEYLMDDGEEEEAASHVASSHRPIWVDWFAQALGMPKDHTLRLDPGVYWLWPGAR